MNFSILLLSICSILIGFIGPVLALLKNCVTPEELITNPLGLPICEVSTNLVTGWTCFGTKNEIIIPRARFGSSVSQSEETLIRCWAQYPIDVDMIARVKVKEFPKIFYIKAGQPRKAITKEPQVYNYTIIIPLSSLQWTPRWFKISNIKDPEVKTEFYVYRNGSDVAQKEEMIIEAESKDAVILPCVASSPSDNIILNKIENNFRKRVIPIDNVKISWEPKIGFTIKTELFRGNEPVWGRYICELQNDRGRNIETFDITLRPFQDLVVSPTNKLVYSYSNSSTILSCKSRNSITMTAILNGRTAPSTFIHSTFNSSLTLSHYAEFHGNSLRKDDLLEITCAEDSSTGNSSSTHTWELHIIDLNQNEVLQFNNQDKNAILCSSNTDYDIDLLNAECFNPTHCKTMESFLSGLGEQHQQTSLIDIIYAYDESCHSSEHSITNSYCADLEVSKLKSKGFFKCFVQSPDASFSGLYLKGYDNKIYTDLDNVPPEALIRIIPPTQLIFINSTNTFKCEASSFVSNGEFIWALKLSNGNLINPRIQRMSSSHDFKRFKDSIWEADIFIGSYSIQEIICLVPKWGVEDTWINISYPINITKPTKPVITNKVLEVEFDRGEIDRNLVCEAEGVPEPNITWYINGSTVQPPFKTERGPTGQVLSFPVVTDEHLGIYTCVATSIGGTDTREFEVEIENLPNVTLYAAIAVPAFILLIVGLGLLYWNLRKAKKAIRTLTDEEVHLFHYGNPDAVQSAKEPHEAILFLPFNPAFEIPRNKLEFSENDVLGSGAFGIVYRGKVLDRPGVAGDVAIKTIKPTSEIYYFKSLLSELKIMVYLGGHENLVGLIGAYTEKIKKRILYMVIELSPYGSLETYLRDHQKGFKNLIRDDQICITNDMLPIMYANLKNRPDAELKLIESANGEKTISTADLVNWSYQITNGMMFLEIKKVIHADLATRNVLLYENNVVKITDFGLSRQLYAYTNYLKQEQEPLPWRWMAIESLREMNFSTQSDVWGFGVTIWEIFSLGAVPYPGLVWSIDFVEKLVQGLRLTKPTLCTTGLYNVMLECWRNEPGQRPSFTTLRQIFEELKSSPRIIRENEEKSRYKIIK